MREEKRRGIGREESGCARESESVGVEKMEGSAIAHVHMAGGNKSGIGASLNIAFSEKSKRDM